MNKLLLALNDCTEWGQIFILDAIVNYRPKSTTEVENVLERVTPRLQHANSAVVLSAVKVMLRLMDLLPDTNELARTVSKKMGPPLVTLLSSEPEIQYVALRNINLITQKRPQVLSSDIKVFFCKYNDPVYVKLEKLECLVRLAQPKTVDTVLAELKEYAGEVDVEFVRRSVRAIGRLAIKMESATERCINVLLGLIQTRINYVVQEAIVVIKDIFRRYPNQYESIISTLCENLETLDEPEAKSSMIWIIGEYAERIENADELLEEFLESFMDESTQVQLQLLTAVVKLFLKRPDGTQEMAQRILKLATEESDNPDLRDRAFVYWRLLSTNPEAAKAIVLVQKPLIEDDSQTISAKLLDELVGNIALLSSVYHKPPEAFVPAGAAGKFPKVDADDDDVDEAEADRAQVAQQIMNQEKAAAVAGTESGVAAPTGLIDLLDFAPPAAAVAAPAASGGAAAGVGPMDLLAGLSGGAPAAAPMPVLCDVEKGQGIEVRGRFQLERGAPVLALELHNQRGAPVQPLLIQFNSNVYGAAPLAPALNVQLPLGPGARTETSVALLLPTAMPASAAQSDLVQVALKAGDSVLYFAAPLGYNCLWAAGAVVPADRFASLWASIPGASSRVFVCGTSKQGAGVTEAMTATNAHHVGVRQNESGQQVLQFSAQSTTKVMMLIEVVLAGGQAQVTFKLSDMSVAALMESAMKALLV